eukprot:CAMPEP_0194039314 /NCGR_PEP_ID=MMETSP0009_2-20130614/11463_1 /TAXON_ID=210454 /ORGANISM="Grammatophora oceanica, Strain CCMP 410" /LENGTH=196 /DNA_ID=CAMNT_0038682117 /DNA_START=26 /DNA_END=616 /DNA_ORIENTATION=+
MKKTWFRGNIGTDGDALIHFWEGSSKVDDVVATNNTVSYGFWTTSATKTEWSNIDLSANQVKYKVFAFSATDEATLKKSTFDRNTIIEADEDDNAALYVYKAPAIELDEVEFTNNNLTTVILFGGITVASSVTLEDVSFDGNPTESDLDIEVESPNTQVTLKCKKGTDFKDAQDDTEDDTNERISDLIVDIDGCDA